jgi:Lon protease-like protein
MKTPKSVADLPKSAPVFPLTGALLLPFTSRPLTIFEPRYVKMIDDVLGADRLIALAQPKDAQSAESPKGKVDLHRIACLGRLTHFEEVEDDRYFIVLEGLTRVVLGDEIETGTPYRQFAISADNYASDFDHGLGENAVNRERFVELLHTYAEFANLDMDWDQIAETGTADLINLCCMLSPYGPAEKQLLLEAKTLGERAEALTALAELEMARAGTTLQ